jgi:hypothetical protein
LIAFIVASFVEKTRWQATCAERVCGIAAAAREVRQVRDRLGL